MNQGIGYGHLPPRETNIVHWNEVCIDLIGPWTIVINSKVLEFKALTSIDPVTSIAERIESNQKQNQQTCLRANNWLTRCPRPNQCIHDNKGEFLGYDFQELLGKMGVQAVQTTVKESSSELLYANECTKQ